LKNKSLDNWFYRFIKIFFKPSVFFHVYFKTPNFVAVQADGLAEIPVVQVQSPDTTQWCIVGGPVVVSW